ncbi:hypothetical protein [Jannaschia rubra]|uniref:Flp pilus assembly protein, pilin Flp n=1 Tax=Jannaschia rubra TaxID=282197 RepID=A0A0M6XRA5_9RHOB|nr:hypothetical protein [Jannaschia rubra]CTQ33666.1 hypothetical protein JAN5088_02450 [Jannaschia rubra]SFG06071.1 hypothetical protein SAMN04488517_102496 [Jannaschia rubra]
MAHRIPIGSFLADERGAVLVDWAILTVAVIVTGNFLFEEVAAATRHLAQDLSDTLGEIRVTGSFSDFDRYR